MRDKVLVIVESPAKAKFIRKYLEKINPKKHFVVEPSLGHIRDLPKDELGIDLNTLYTTYVPDAKKQNTIGKIKKHLTRVSEVILATDNDREGEAIAWHIKEMFNIHDGQYKRMIFNEITPDAIKAAYNNMKLLDYDLVHSQQARRLIDRIMGFKLSPLLWKHFKVGNGSTALSAGRVQSATMKIIMDKETVVKDAVSTPYWTLGGTFSIGGVGDSSNGDDSSKRLDDCKLHESASGNIYRFESEDELKKYLQSLKNKFVVKSKKLFDSKESPAAPFITSTLQQEAFNVLGFPVKATMAFAQTLYERGYITYMRTDSYTLSSQAMKQISKFIVDKFGEASLNIVDYANRKSSKNSQEAHEAIRPTNIYKDGHDIREINMRRLYDLIHKRTIASQMTPAVHSILELYISDAELDKCPDDQRVFVGKMRMLKVPGYLAIYDKKAEDVAQLQALADTVLASPVVCYNLHGKHTWSNAPGRFNEANIVKILEQEGVGRPSTYAGILEKLYMKNYIVRQDTQGTHHIYTDYYWNPDTHEIINKKYEGFTNAEKARLIPMEIGAAIHGFLDAHFNDMIDVQFTAKMESLLDDIADGKITWQEVVRKFWAEFGHRLAQIENTIVAPKDRVVLETEKKNISLRGTNYIVRLAKYGPVLEYVPSGNIDNFKAAEKHYIDLKPYLRLYGKAYTDINADDVSRLTKFPMTIGDDTKIMYGRYGFYMMQGDTTYMIPLTFIKKDLSGDILNMSPNHINALMENKNNYLKRKAEKVSEKLHGIKPPQQHSEAKQKKGAAAKKKQDNNDTSTKKKKAPVKNKEKYIPKSVMRQRAAQDAGMK